MKNKKNLFISFLLLALFVVWTALVKLIDIRPIGPFDSYVGLSSVNQAFHSFTGVNMFLYYFTDLLSLIPIFVALTFAVIGLFQFVKRKHILKVDKNILLLGAFYLLVSFIFLYFEKYPINFRPILINGVLEASYPSSSTLLVGTVMPTAVLQLRLRLQNSFHRKLIEITINLYTTIMIVFRALSGVHWLSDIIGGILLSSALVMAYYSLIKMLKYV